ncbi:uncharacterized protein LOC115451139 [Manduca sexta]|uniref:uncharacterized protein LOC115451139 n=1 Tax=Manduca sexta TaxID=7130 RepID=UPI00188F1AD8|nr:uncharacterized protein LOC115451139 [Manduca sexta]
MDNSCYVSNKLCFKCDQKLFGSLDIACNTLNYMTILWNKYQILVYEKLCFKTATRVIEPEFQILDLLLHNNHIACLDCSGNIHVISLKFKNPTQKKFKSCFQPRKQDILAFAQYNSDGVLTLQYSMGALYLSFHMINKEFQIENELQLLLDNDQISSSWTRDNCILKSHSLTTLKGIEQLFDIKECSLSNFNLVIISFDKLSIYAAVVSPKMIEDETKLIKIYSSPTEICNIEVVEEDNLNIVIGLSIGSIITIPLTKDRKPIITHLSTAIHKFYVFKDTLIHTDGCTMWNTENLYSKRTILNKFFVRQVKDFIKVNNKIICTTFSNLIYIFSNDETSYVKSQNSEEYLAVDKLLNNTDCLNKIMEEVEKNNELVKKLRKEENYITALSLSNRQDIMNNIITTKVIVFENYEDASKEYVPITLTESIEEYFRSETMLYLINILINTSHTITSNIFSNLFTDFKIHVTFSSDNKLLKTTSVELGQLNKVNYLIPLKNTSTRIDVNITFVTNIPGAYDEKETAWNVLYRKHVLLKSENFILINNTTDKVLLLNKTDGTDELLLKTVQNTYGNEFTFIDQTKCTKEDEWSLYVKLPTNYPNVLKNSDYCDKYLNLKTSKYLSQLYTSDEFLKSKSNFVINVSKDKVKLEIVNDGFSNPVLKITSGNLQVALDIRNFFAGLIYNKFNNYVPDEEFISQTFYTTVENVQNAVKSFITKGLDPEEFNPLVDRFERNVIGALPL